jgi:hypothetical protein
MDANQHNDFDEEAFLVPLQTLISKQVGLSTAVFVIGRPGTPETKVKTQPGKPGYDLLLYLLFCLFCLLFHTQKMDFSNCKICLFLDLTSFK